MPNAAAVLTDGARSVPERTAVAFGELRLSYARLDALANQVANLLVEFGIAPGERVALSCPNIPAFPVAYYGILKAGAVVVPLDTALDAAAVADRLTDSGARAYLCFEGTPGLAVGDEGYAGFSQVEACEHFVVLSADLDATSPIPGTRTLPDLLRGQPESFEPVPRTAADQAVLVYSADGTQAGSVAHGDFDPHTLDALRTSEWAEDVVLIALPLFEPFGQAMLLHSGLRNRATLVLLARFVPAATIAAMVRERVSVFAGPSATFPELFGAVDFDDELAVIAARLRLAVYRGPALPSALRRRMGEHFDLRIVEGHDPAIRPAGLGPLTGAAPRPRSIRRAADVTG